MEEKHEIINFSELLKISFRPVIPEVPQKLPKFETESDPLSLPSVLASWASSNAKEIMKNIPDPLQINLTMQFVPKQGSGLMAQSATFSLRSEETYIEGLHFVLNMKILLGGP